MTKITADALHKLWPSGNSKVPGLIEGISAATPAVLDKYGLTSDLVVAHAMAQFSHECRAGTEMVENVRYTAERAAQVWPSRFKSAADCYAKVGSFAGDPDFDGKLIDSVYGTRMGNRPGTHDGRTYIGRGLSQVTGRNGYDALGRKTGDDLLTHPELVTHADRALEFGVADFVLCGCLPFAERDDVVGVTQRLNGGQIGITERKMWLARWKTALGAPATTAMPPPVANTKRTKKVASAAASGAAAGAAAHGAGFPVWAVIAAVVGIAVIGYLVAHFVIKKGS